MSLVIAVICVYFAIKFFQRYRFAITAGFCLLVLLALSRLRVPDGLLLLMVPGWIGLLAFWIRRRFRHNDHGHERSHEAARRRERVRLPVSSLEDE